MVFADPVTFTLYRYVTNKENPFAIVPPLMAVGTEKIHHIPYSLEHCHFMKLVKLGCDVEKAITLTM